MKIKERTMDISDIIISSEQELPRTPGIHVSGIINYLSQSLGRRDNDFSRIDLDHFALLGRVFETVLARSIYRPPRYERIGEIEHDGIIGSPDVWDTETAAIGEIKLTWKSSRHDIIEFREYLWQLKSYCHMLQTQKAWLIVLFVCGDWKPPVPVLKRWDIEFTKGELQDNWTMMINNAAAAVSHVS